MRQLLFLTLLTAAVLLPGCDRPSLQGKAPGAHQVKVSVARTGQLPHLLEISGEISSTRKGVVNAEQSGIVERVGCRVGEKVFQGQEVIWLRPGRAGADVSQQEAALRSAEAEVARQRIQVEYAHKQHLSEVAQAQESLRQAEIAISQARTQLSADLSDRDRKRELLTQKAIAQFDVEQAVLKVKISQDQLSTAQSKAAAARNSLLLARQGEAQVRLQQAELNKAEASVAQADASLEAARIELRTALIYAPMSGVVVERQVEPGQSVGPGGGPLLSIVDTSASDITCNVDSRFASLLHKGLIAQVTSALTRGHFEARLEGVSPSGDAKTNTLKARFRPLHLPSELVNGTSVRLSLNLENRSGVLVPLAAVRGEPGGQQWVWVVRHEKVSRLVIEEKCRDDSTALVEKGVEPGDSLVILGAENLKDGDNVQVLQIREPYPSEAGRQR